MPQLNDVRSRPDRRGSDAGSEPPAGVNSEIQEDSMTYRFSIVFSGIVPLVTEEDGGKPKRLWALVSNLRNPEELDEKKILDLSGIHPHLGRLLFDEKHLESAGGRTHKAGDLCPEGTKLRYFELDNEDFTLEGGPPNSSLHISRGQMVPPTPCDPNDPKCKANAPQKDQEADFDWMIDIDTIARELARDPQNPPRLQRALLKSPYKPAGPKLLSARFAFDRGRVSTAAIDRDDDGNFRISSFGFYDLQNRPIHERTVATRVRLTLPRVKGKMTLAAKRLDDPRVELEPIVFTNKGDPEVVVYIDNNPALACDQYKHHHDKPHFLVNYCLFDDLTAYKEFRVPRPVDEDGGELPPVLNAQCSPPRSTSS